MQCTPKRFTYLRETLALHTTQHHTTPHHSTTDRPTDRPIQPIYGLRCAAQIFALYALSNTHRFHYVLAPHALGFVGAHQTGHHYRGHIPRLFMRGGTFFTSKVYNFYLRVAFHANKNTHWSTRKFRDLSTASFGATWRCRGARNFTTPT